MSRATRLRPFVTILASALTAFAMGSGCGLSVTGTSDAADDAALPARRSPAGTTDGAPSGPITATGSVEAGPPCGTAGVCVTSPPGWSLVVIAQSRLAGDATYAPAVTCPTGWTNPRAGVENPHSASPSCSCTCGPSIGSPCQQTVNMVAGAETTGAACNDISVTLTTDGVCHSLNGTNWSASATKIALSIAPQQVSCNPVTTTLPGLADDGAWAICDIGPSATEGTCSNGICVDSPGAITMCLASPGTQACPNTTDKRHVIVPPANVSGLTRGCAPCACATHAASCSGVLHLYTDSSCTMNERLATLDGACNSINGGMPPTDYEVTAVPNDDSCTPSPPNPAVTGSVATSGEITLCCP